MMRRAASLEVAHPTVHGPHRLSSVCTAHPRYVPRRCVWWFCWEVASVVDHFGHGSCGGEHRGGVVGDARGPRRPTRAPRSARYPRPSSAAVAYQPALLVLMRVAGLYHREVCGSSQGPG
eukprot:3587623-Rhodomonas_salina.1